jgi:hypothetical protein
MMLRTELKELPPLEGRSKYDYLLEELDRNVVVLLRGEDFERNRTTNAVRSDLARWAKHRSVKVSARVCWAHPETGEASPFKRDGKPLPWGLYVKVRSREGKDSAKARPAAKRGKKRTKNR